METKKLSFLYHAVCSKFRSDSVSICVKQTRMMKCQQLGKKVGGRNWVQLRNGTVLTENPRNLKSYILGFIKRASVNIEIPSKTPILNTSQNSTKSPILELKKLKKSQKKVVRLFLKKKKIF